MISEFAKVCRMPLRLIIILLIIFWFAACSTLTNPYVISESFIKSNYKRVGLLVTRMGYPKLALSPITLNTDYSIRIPKTDINIYPYPPKEQIDVYIEDESRLRESLPNYPYFEKTRLEKAKYYRNITPQLFQNVQYVMEKKGYQVLDVVEFSKKWPKPISEMTIDEILSSLSGIVDALFVVHYIDQGDREYDDLAHKAKFSGFTHLHYTVSMFSASTKERILYFHEDCGQIHQAIANDPDIKNDPENRDRIKYNKGTSFPGTKYYNSLELDFSDEEIIKYVMKLMRTGTTFRVYSGDLSFVAEWKSLESLIP